MPEITSPKGHRPYLRASSVLQFSPAPARVRIVTGITRIFSLPAAKRVMHRPD